MPVKRGQAASAASLLALLAVFILLYLLVIPPDFRDELLGDTGTSKTPDKEQPTKFAYNKTVFQTTPGRLDFQAFKEYDHPLPAVNLFSTTSAQEMLVGNSVFVKNGLFEKKNANLTFKIDEGAHNVLLSFKTNPNRNNNGRLTIYLNGRNLFEKQTTGILEPIPLKGLEKTNTLTFEVSGVGYRFWRTNEYELDDVTVFFDTVDVSTQSSKNLFMVTESEKLNLDKATLTFYPDCKSNDIGRLNVNLNRDAVFSAVPDCGYQNRIELSPSSFDIGQNKVSFKADGGRYLIDQINVHTELKTLIYPTYYFDMESQFFTEDQTDETTEECGDVDGVCPRGCDDDLDRDCCLKESSNYWCDYQPDNQDDRCRAVTSTGVCQLCPSGYEDDNGNPPSDCEDLCGDDTDNECLPDCSRYFDEDCCFDFDEDNFWCDDIPKFGLATCKDAITNDECDACPEGWVADASDFRCSSPTTDGEPQLKSQYDVELTLLFTDDKDRKAGKVFINGRQFNFVTYSDEYVRNINRYVELDSNAIRIEPDRTALDIRKLLVEVKE